MPTTRTPQPPASVEAAASSDIKSRPLSLAERAARSLAESRQQRLPLEIQLLLAGLDLSSAQSTITGAFVPEVADWSFLYLVDDDGIPRRVAVGYSDEGHADLAARIRAVTPGPGWANLAAQAIRDRTPRLFQEVSEEVLRWASHDDEHLAALRAIAPRSILVLPFVARDRVVGGVTLMRGAGRPPFSEEDLVAATKLTAPMALALDNAREVSALREARNAAERQGDVERHERLLTEAALLRLRRLQSLASSLSAALPPAAVARVAFEGALAILGPNDGAVALAVGERLEVVHAPGWPAEVLRDWSIIPPDAPALIAEAWRTQRPIWISSTDDLWQRYASAAALAQRLGGQAYAAVPITADGICLGALNIGFKHARILDDSERDYVLAVASLIGQAVARARLRGQP
ncbi:MAG TPA: GAF domain-containing protein [Anaeromyxobacteraceae bacterium]|nr:GAF domain-containing protein [Anaeromyxobacteraceae bacterium]